MTKQQFLKLLNKLEKGTCSENEKELLFHFSEEVQQKEFNFFDDLSEKDKARIRVLKRINSSIHQNNNKSQEKAKQKRVWQIAVVVIGLLLSSYLFLQLVNNDDEIIINNQITLELEDGTIQIIEEKGSSNIIDRKGNIVGKQNGNQLAYNIANVKNETTYNTLKVPYSKRFELLLSDGTIAYLNAGSSIKYPVQFSESNDRQVFISGEAYLNVAKDSLRPFIVNADNLNIRVLGTKFNVNAYPEDSTVEVVLVGGAVGLYNINEVFDLTTTKLEPNYKASFNKATNDIVKNKVITSIYTSWRKGELVFRNMTFRNITKKLERYYGVSITINNENLSNTIFNASFGNEPLDVVLESLKINYGIQYAIEDEKVIIN